MSSLSNSTSFCFWTDSNRDNPAFYEECLSTSDSDNFEPMATSVDGQAAGFSDLTIAIEMQENIPISQRFHNLIQAYISSDAEYKRREAYQKIEKFIASQEFLSVDTEEFKRTAKMAQIMQYAKLTDLFEHSSRKNELETKDSRATFYGLSRTYV